MKLPRWKKWVLYHVVGPFEVLALSDVPISKDLLFKPGRPTRASVNGTVQMDAIEEYEALGLR